MEQAAKVGLPGQDKFGRIETTSSTSPTPVLCERRGGGGVANGSQVILFFMKVMLKIFARVTWTEERAVPLRLPLTPPPLLSLSWASHSAFPQGDLCGPHLV